MSAALSPRRPVGPLAVRGRGDDALGLYRPAGAATGVGREGRGAWMEPVPEQREVEGRGGAFWYEVPH
jgi:hypothetical protein